MTAEQERAAVVAWAVKRSNRLRDEMADYIMKGGDIETPEYRSQLGEGRAYMALRSFLSQRGDHHK
jgi:hypothetical protein